MDFAGTNKSISNGKMLLVLLGSFAHLVLQSHDMCGYLSFCWQCWQKIIGPSRS